MMKYLILALWLATQSLAFANQAGTQTQLSSKSQLVIERLKDDIRHTMGLIALAEKNKMRSLAEFSYKLVLEEYHQIRLGLVLEFNEKANAFSVLSVSPNSLASSAGIKVNDKIFSVNYKRVDSDNSESILQSLLQLEVEEELILETNISGKRQELTIPIKGTFVPKVEIQFGCCIAKDQTESTQHKQVKPQVSYAPKTRQIIDKLASTIQSTVAAIVEYEKEDGIIEGGLSYSIFIPATSKTNLGLSINIDDITNGILVQSVEQGSIAAQLDIASNDVIIEVNDLLANEENKQDIINQLQALKAGDSLLLSVQQQDKIRSLALEIEEQTFPEVNINVGLLSNEPNHLLARLGDESKIPTPFRGENNLSTLTINYRNLNILLKLAVLEMGRSGRAKAKVVSANMGTRLRPTQKRLTSLEGNRFYFEAFKEQSNKRALHKIRTDLAQLPSSTPLANFSKKEQLAYWLNLYNVTLLDELVAIYPKKHLEFLFDDEDGLVNQKILNVANVPLSLNDIKNVILKEKYNHDPDVLYGLYQGAIGGPNIREEAYTGKNVYRALASNAEEFVNSNRGTYRKNSHTFLISSLYADNADYFPNFQEDVTAHLLKYVEGYYRSQLQGASAIKANISNWNISDVYGTIRNFGGGNHTNPAGMIGAISDNYINVVLENAALNGELGLVSPQGRQLIEQLFDKHLQNTTSVTVTDLEPSSTKATPNKKTSTCKTKVCNELFNSYEVFAKSDKWASYYVSLLHFNGIGTEQSTKRALFRLKKVINRNWPGGAFNPNNKSTEKSRERALSRLGTELNSNWGTSLFEYQESPSIYAKTYYQLGYIYLVDEMHGDINKAISNLTRATELGGFRATFLLGLIYLTDEYGVEDSNLATQWLGLAMRQIPQAFNLLLSSYGVDNLSPDKDFDWQIEQLKQALIKQGKLQFDSTEEFSSPENIENMQAILAKLKSAQRGARSRRE